MGINLILRARALTAAQRAQAQQSLSRGLSLDDLELVRETVPGVRHAAPLAQVSATVFDAATDRPPEVVATTREYFDAKGLEVADCSGSYRFRMSSVILSQPVSPQTRAQPSPVP